MARMNCKSFELCRGEATLRGTCCLPENTEARRGAWVILCHGIPGGTASPDDPGYLHLAQRICEAGYRSLAFNFRGAGDSTGDFDISGWGYDLKRVINYVGTLCPNLPRIVLFGFSAGAAVSVYVAAHDERVAGLILAASPADFDEIVSGEGPERFLTHARTIGIIRNPGFPYNRTDWISGFRVLEPDRWISRIKDIPILILHGDCDETVPISHGYRLYEKASQPKKLMVINGGGHRLRLNQEAMEAALNWLKATIT